jgi:hypothetical protein
MLKTDPDPATIISALENEDFPWKAPLWGGEVSYTDPRHRLVVLPPMRAGDLAELTRNASERHFGATLVTADTVAAGACVVALSFYPVTGRGEILPPLYACFVEALTPEDGR